jgi:hypothetical protein
LNRPQRWLAATALATAWAITEDGLLLLLMLVAAARALFDKPSDRPDRGALVHYIALVAALSLLAFSHWHCVFGEASNFARAGRSFRFANSSSIPKLALLVVLESVPACLGSENMTGTPAIDMLDSRDLKPQNHR